MKRLSFCIALALAISLCFAAPLMAQGQENVAASLLESFTSRTDSWWGALQSYSFGIFKIVLIIDVCLFGFQMAMPGSDVGSIFKEFISLLVFAGFIALVIANYKDWSQAVAINGLEPLVGELTGNSVDAGKPFAVAAEIGAKVLIVLGEAGMTDIINVILLEICMLIILIVFILISALVILVQCEFYIVANIGVLLIGLGGSRLFKDYAINVMRYVLSIAFKLFVLQIIVNIGFSIISLASPDSTIGNSISDINFVEMFLLIGQSVILLALAKTLPESCAGMLSGASIGGGNPLGGMAQSVVTMAGGAAMGGALKAASAGMNMASTAKGAFDAARIKGASGVGGTLSGMKQAYSEARDAAKTARKDDRDAQAVSSPGSIRSQLRSQSMAAKAQQDAMKMEAAERAAAAAAAEVPTPPIEAAPAENAPSVPEPPLGAQAGFKQSEQPPIWQQMRFK